MAKKKQDLSPEERLAAALVPEEEWPYALPDGWKWVRLLGGAATCMDNKRKPVNSKERANRIGEIPYYGATGQVGWIDEYLTNEELILLGEDGAPFLDILKTKAYIINGKSWVNNHAHILKSFMGHIGNLYLMYYLNNFDYRKYVSGTTRLKLTQGKMKNIPVPYPPLSEQRRLVARIESLFAKLDAAREKVQSVLDSHETRKAALLHDAFAGKLTAKWREEHQTELRESKQFPSKLKSAPNHANALAGKWALVRLGDVVTWSSGGTPSRKHPEYYSGDIPWVKTGELNNTYIYDTSEKITKDAIAQSSAKMLPVNTVLLAMYGATIGKVGILGVEAATNQACACGICSEWVDYRFLFYYLQSQKSSFIRSGKGGAQPNISQTIIKQYDFPLPSLPEQQEIVRILGRLLAREQRARQAAEETLTAIDRMKQAILARAFRGEL